MKHWKPPEDGRSTATHVQVPIHNESGRWGVLEVSFGSGGGLISSIFRGGSIVAVILFITLAGFVAYWLFLKRALNELDPGQGIHRQQIHGNQPATGVENIRRHLAPATRRSAACNRWVAE